MPRSKFVEGKTYDGTHFLGTRMHKELSQRDTLETAILNLAELAGIGKIERAASNRGFIYKAGSTGFMSASNLVLELTNILTKPRREAEREARRQKRFERDATKAE